MSKLEIAAVILLIIVSGYAGHLYAKVDRAEDRSFYLEGRLKDCLKEQTERTIMKLENDYCRSPADCVRDLELFGCEKVVEN